MSYCVDFDSEINGFVFEKGGGGGRGKREEGGEVEEEEI